VRIAFEILIIDMEHSVSNNKPDVMEIEAICGHRHNPG
jgi:hypothetical protein